MKTFEEFSVGKNRTLFNKPTSVYPDGHTEVAVHENLYKQIQREAWNGAIEKAEIAVVQFMNKRPLDQQDVNAGNLFNILYSLRRPAEAKEGV